MSKYTVKDHSQMIKLQVEHIMRFAKHPIEVHEITHVEMYVDEHGEYQLNISFSVMRIIQEMEHES